MATAEEKYVKHVTKLNKKDKIERMVDSVSDWEVKDLIEFVQDVMHTNYDLLTPQEVTEAYLYQYMEDDLEDAITWCDDEQEEDPVLAKIAPKLTKCQCDLNELMLNGHSLDCPEKK